AQVKDANAGPVLVAKSWADGLKQLMVDLQNRREAIFGSITTLSNSVSTIGGLAGPTPAQTNNLNDAITKIQQDLDDLLVFLTKLQEAIAAGRSQGAGQDAQSVPRHMEVTLTIVVTGDDGNDTPELVTVDSGIEGVNQTVTTLRTKIQSDLM